MGEIAQHDHDSDSNKKTPRKPRPSEQTQKHKDDNLTTLKTHFCTNCGKMEDNPDFKEPKYQCINCNYPIPLAQGTDGVCPQCGCPTWKTYESPTYDADNVKKKMEESGLAIPQ